MGGVGETGGLAANTLAKDADVVIGVGTRYTDFTTSSKWIFQNPNVQYVNINVSRFHAYKLDGIQVVGDAGAALEMLDEALGKTGYHVSDAYAADIKAAKAAYTKEVERVFHIQFGDNFVPEVNDDFDYKAAEKAYKEAVGETLPQTRVLGLLEEHMDPNGIIVGASGSLPGDLQRVWRPKTVGSYHVEYGFSCMGYEVNAALGVKLAEPQREVYALVGDYAYMMLHSELPTSIAEGKKINVILFDNMQGGCINNLEIGHGQGSYGTEFRFRNEKTGQLDGAYVPVDFAMNAASYGCKSYTAHTEEELIAAIEDAKKQKVSTLIDCKVMPKTMVHGYRTGTGLVQIYTAKENLVILQSQIPEAIITTYEKYDVNELHRLIDWADVVAIGSGLGTKKTARKILKETVAYTKKPCVIDADGLNILSEHMDYLCGADCEHFIFTPHMKEFERISGLKIAEVKKDRIAALRTFVEEYDVTCVLKDSRTTIAKPRERVAVNLSGCAAMAKAGSGDVLAGIIASYLAQGLSEWEAALLGVYIHGRAGEIIEKEQGAYSLLARELAQKAGTAMTVQEEN